MIAEALAAEIRAKKAVWDANRPLWQAALAAIEHFHDVELTYTSNAIEGNTLSHGETALVIEKGITIGGKSLAEHLEAQDHHGAVRFVRELAQAGRTIGEDDVVALHRRIVLRSQPGIAGVYSRLPRRVAGSAVVFPNPTRIPELMADFGRWLAATPDTYLEAFEAQLRLVSIHPFADGNGRTARLLMNLLLIRGGYPPIAIGPEHRLAYLDAIERAQVRGEPGPYMNFFASRLDTTLAAYIDACRQGSAT